MNCFFLDLILNCNDIYIVYIFVFVNCIRKGSIYFMFVTICMAPAALMKLAVYKHMYCFPI